MENAEARSFTLQQLIATNVFWTEIYQLLFVLPAWRGAA